MVASSCEPMPLSAMMTDETVIGWGGGLLLAQLVLMTLIRRSHIISMKAKSAFSSQKLVCLVPFVYAAAAGTRLLYDGDALEQRASPSYAARYFDCTPAQRTLVKMMLGFQAYDVLTTAVVPELRKAEHLAHHVTTGVFACLALFSRSLLYYSYFFFGLSEISSICLVFVDLFRQCPGLLASSRCLSTFNEVTRLCFGLTFLSIRCLAWPYVMVSLVRDIVSAHAAADPRFWYPGASFYVTTTVLMSLLQQYWGLKVVKGMVKMARGDRSGREKEN
jgi:hypothetical protein